MGMIQQTWWEWINYWMSQSAANWHPIAWAMDNNPIVIGIHLIAGSILALTFFFLGISLAFQSKRQGFVSNEHRWVAVFFVTFIWLCGLTFVVREVTIFYPIFWIYGSVKLITSLFAFLTALTYARMLPYLLKLPTIKDFAQVENEKRQLERKAKLLNEHIAVWTSDVGYHINLLKGQQKALIDDLANKGLPVTRLDETNLDTPISKAEALASLEKIKAELEMLVDSINEEVPQNK